MIVAQVLREAFDHYRTGRIAEAVRLYRSILQRQPGNPQANANLGLIAVRSGQLEAALPLFSVAIRNAPAAADIRIVYARTLLALGRVKETIAAVDVANEAGHTGLPELEVLKARAVSLKPLTVENGIAQVPKVFCIGCNKTGTTSMAAALTQLGYKMGAQSSGEMLIEDWGQRRFGRIIDLCRTASAFQDVPFSLPYTFQALDQAYPGSKFVLTQRTNADEWFTSLTRFHTKIVGKGRLPTAEDLQALPYRYEGWLWRAIQLTYGINARTLYLPEIFKTRYLSHNQQVMDYFMHRPADLLVVNLIEADAMERVCAFLGFSGGGLKVPHLNRSSWPRLNVDQGVPASGSASAEFMSVGADDTPSSHK
jgi:Sulfotransferase domain/Tetratricopeptide repeat